MHSNLDFFANIWKISDCLLFIFVGGGSLISVASSDSSLISSSPISVTDSSSAQSLCFCKQFHVLLLE